MQTRGNLIIVCVWLLAVMQQVDGVCDRSQVAIINSCYNPVREHIQDIEGQYWSRVDLEQLCLHVADAVACAEDTIRRCDASQVDVLQDETNTVLHVCDNIDFYMEHQNCLRGDELQEELDTCLYTEHHYMTAEDLQELCGHVQHDLDCVYTHVSAVCGENVATFQMTLERMGLSNQLETVGCHVLTYTPPPPTAPPYLTAEPGTCSHDVINQCLENSQSFFRRAAHVQMDRHQFETQCIFLQESYDCARPYLAHCSRRDQEAAHIRGLLQAHQYLCDVIDDFFVHQTCLVKPSLQADMLACMYPLEHYDDKDNVEQICSQWSHDLDCVSTHVTQRCHNRDMATTIMYQYWFLKYSPQMDAINCDWNTGYIITPSPPPQPNPQPVKKNTDDTDTGLIIGLAVGGVGLVVLVVVIVAYVVSRNRRRERPARIDELGVAVTASSGSTALENPMYGVTGERIDNLTLSMQPPAYETPVDHHHQATGVSPDRELASAHDYEKLPPTKE